MRRISYALAGGAAAVLSFALVAATAAPARIPLPPVQNSTFEHPRLAELAKMPPPDRVRPNQVVAAVNRILGPKSGPLEWHNGVKGLALHCWKLDRTTALVLYGPRAPLGYGAGKAFDPKRAFTPVVVCAKIIDRVHGPTYVWLPEIVPGSGNFATTIDVTKKSGGMVWAFDSWKAAIAAYRGGTERHLDAYAKDVAGLTNVRVRW